MAQNMMAPPTAEQKNHGCPADQAEFRLFVAPAELYVVPQRLSA